MNEKDINIEDKETTLSETQEQAQINPNAEVPTEEDATEEADKQTETEDTEEAHEPTLEERLEEALAEVEKYKDLYLRSVAEFDNFRRRTMKEKAELILNGGARTIEALLPVLDDFERAQASMNNENANLDTLREGVNLIEKKLADTLSQQGLKRMEVLGKDFDTDFHEAIALVPTDDAEKKGKVIDCVATGYLLNDRVLRHAKVAVGQ